MSAQTQKQLLDENGHLVQFQYYDAVTDSYLPVNATNPLPTSGGGGGSSLNAYAITQTVVAVTGTSATLIAANASRKFLAWMVVGTQDVTVAAGTAAAVMGVGQVYQSGGANKQGASEEFPQGVPTNAFTCIAAGAGSSMVVWEGA
jgi:hypothetical protein